MLEKISNCLSYRLNKAILVREKDRKSLYVLEILSPLILKSDSKSVMLQPYDILLAQSLPNLELRSLDQSPLVLRLYTLIFDLPSPLSQYTVGDNPLIHDLMNEQQASQARILFSSLEDGVCHAYLDAIEHLENLPQQDSYSSFQIQKVSGLLFTELLRQHEQKISKSASQFPTAKVKYASRDTQAGTIMKYIRDHIDQATLKGTAQHFSYQPNYFSRLCQHLFGLTFNQLKTTIKLEIAKEQLSLTTKSLEEISQELGYKAVSNFYRNFKVQTGMTPREYREESRLTLLRD